MYLENNLFYLAASPSIFLLSASLTSNSSLLRVKSQNLRNLLERPFKLNEPIKIWRKATRKKENTIQTACDLQWFDLRVFDFTMVQKPYVFSGSHTLNFEFRSFPGLEICRVILSCDTGQQQQAAAPHQPCSHEGKQLILYSLYEIILTNCRLMYQRSEHVWGRLG